MRLPSYDLALRAYQSAEGRAGELKPLAIMRLLRMFRGRNNTKHGPYYRAEAWKMLENRQCLFIT